MRRKGGQAITDKSMGFCGGGGLVFVFAKEVKKQSEMELGHLGGLGVIRPNGLYGVFMLLRGGLFSSVLGKKTIH